MRLKTFIRKDLWPLYVAVTVFLISVFLLTNMLLQQTNGIFSLPHDASFLQLATAKNLAFKHVWGIERESFAAASTSLTYPFLLAAAFFIFGVHAILTVIVNTVICILFLAFLQKWLTDRGTGPSMRLIILLAVVVLAPLSLMAVFGMEEAPLLLFAFLFLSGLSDEWSGAAFSQRTLIYGSLLVASRYDGVLLVILVCLLLLLRRKWLAAYAMVLCCLLPIFIFGFIALNKGGYFLPNALVLRPAGEWLTIDWLIVLGIAVIIPLMQSYLSRHSLRNIRWVGGVALLVVIPSLLFRNWYAYQAITQSSKRVYAQEYPLARFMYRCFRSNSVASDDIGMIAYLTDGRHLDLSGLANGKVARSRNGNFFSPELIDNLSNQGDIRMAVISDSFHQGLPDTWIRTCRWEWPASMPYDRNAFDFYAIDTSMVRYLKDQLVAYTPFLPPDMTVRYYK